MAVQGICSFLLATVAFLPLTYANFWPVESCHPVIAEQMVCVRLADELDCLEPDRNVSVKHLPPSGGPRYLAKMKVKLSAGL